MKKTQNNHLLRNNIGHSKGRVKYSYQLIIKQSTIKIHTLSFLHDSYVVIIVNRLYYSRSFQMPNLKSKSGKH